MRFHFLEPSASVPIRTFIEETAPEVWEELSRPGMGGPENCLAAVNLWATRLRDAGIPFEQLGSQTVIGYSQAGGYRHSDGTVVDHHFIAVGAELALFDPTAGSLHIGHTPDIPLDCYVDWDGSPFPIWRQRRLEKGR